MNYNLLNKKTYKKLRRKKGQMINLNMQVQETKPSVKLCAF